MNIAAIDQKSWEIMIFEIHLGIEISFHKKFVSFDGQYYKLKLFTHLNCVNQSNGAIYEHVDEKKRKEKRKEKRNAYLYNTLTNQM